MRTHIGSGMLGLALGMGLAAGLGSAGPGERSPWSPPQSDRPRTQPDAEQALPEDPVARELALLHRGLFREQSELPTDPALSIEQMLIDQGAAIARLDGRLGAADPIDIDAFEQRLTDFERALATIDTSGVARVESEVQSVRRSLENLSHALDALPRGDLGTLVRSVDELERKLTDETERSIDSLRDAQRDTKSSIRSLEDRVRLLERKIP
jgi:hypothetical protein